jgi:hypothetical protein
MIVRPGDRVLHLITQPDHAALAYRIMDRWEALHDAARRASILLAVAEHDNGWREPDAAPSVDPGTGRIHDFVTAPAAVRQAVWPRGVARLANEANDPWAAALVAEHAVTVYDRFRSDAQWSNFFAEMEATRDRMVGASGRTAHQLAADYAYVRIGDLISLTFCSRWTDPQKFERWTIQLDGDRVTVSPNSFAVEFSIEVECREIADRVYRSDAELAEALRSAPSIALTGLVAISPRS